MWEGYITAHEAYGTHTLDARQCRPDSEHKRAAARLDGGGVRCSGRCAKGARLEQDDVVRDVPRVRVDGRRHDVSEVVREEVTDSGT